MSVQRPIVSRKPLVFLVCICLAVAAVAIPAAAHLPAWIEVEFVLLAWWAVWVGVLTYLLYGGLDVDDDTVGPTLPAVDTDTLYGASDGASQIAGCFIESCWGPILAIVAALLVGLAIAFVIEFLIPAIALLLIASIGGMLARVANDRHGCHHRFGPSLLWGVLWATIYIAPVAAVVLWVAAIAKHR